MKFLKHLLDVTAARTDAHRYAVERDKARTMAEHFRQQRDLFHERWLRLLTVFERSEWENDALSAELRRMGKDPSKVLEAADRANGGRLKWVQSKDWTEPTGETA